MLSLSICLLPRLINTESGAFWWKPVRSCTHREAELLPTFTRWKYIPWSAPYSNRICSLSSIRTCGDYHIAMSKIAKKWLKRHKNEGFSSLKIGWKSFFLFWDFKNSGKIKKICVFTSISKHIHRPTIQYGNHRWGSPRNAARWQRTIWFYANLISSTNATSCWYSREAEHGNESP